MCENVPMIIYLIISFVCCCYFFL